MIVNIFSHKTFKVKNSNHGTIYQHLETKYPNKDEINGSLITPISETFTKEQWANIYKDNISAMISAMSLTGTPVIREMWCNAYNTGTELTKHNHGTGRYVGMHYVKYLPGEHNPTVFYENGTSNNKTTVDIEEGDLLIIPSELYHEVAPNTSTNIRVVAVFSLELVGKAAEEHKNDLMKHKSAAPPPINNPTI